MELQNHPTTLWRNNGKAFGKTITYRFELPGKDVDWVFAFLGSFSVLYVKSPVHRLASLRAFNCGFPGITCFLTDCE